MNSKLEQVKKDIALLREEEARIIKEQEDETYCEGDRFTDGWGCEYMIVYTGEACLVTVERGHYWSKGVDVESPCKITAEEFKQMCGSGTFTRIE